MLGQWRLYDVADVGAFVNAIVAKQRPGLSYHDREDLEAFLIVECWQLSLRFDPDRGSFSTFAGGTLRRRVVDFDRKRYRTRWVFRTHVYERPRPQFVPLDDAGLDDAVGHSSVDGDDDRLAAELRLLHARDVARRLHMKQQWCDARLAELAAEIERLDAQV